MPACRDKFSRQQASLISHLCPWRLWLLRALPKINCQIVKLWQPTQGRQEMSCHWGLRMTQWRLRTFDASGEEGGCFNLDYVTTISSTEKVVPAHRLQRPEQAKQMKKGVLTV